MEREKLLHEVAPCSLLCYTCTGYKDGVIAECAKKLHTYLDGFEKLVGRNMSKEDRENWYRDFNTFRGTLANIGGGCHGCRADASLKGGCIEGCVIPECVKERGVDFCADCREFPCQRARDFFASYDGKVEEVWEKGTERIREIGIEAYFEERKNVSHYLHYNEETE